MPAVFERLLRVSLGGMVFLAGYGLGVTSSARMPVADLAPNPAPATPAFTVGNLTAARIIFEAQEGHLGKVRLGKTRQHTFRFVNRGTEVLRLGNILSGCHCSVAYTQARRLEPGQGGELVATYDPTGQPTGPFRRTLILETNDSSQPITRLELIGEVVP